jgi:hypothetical protein
MTSADESNITELEIGPDGRIYIFGASLQVLEVLDRLHFTDNLVHQRAESLQRRRASSTTSHTTATLDCDRHE